MYCIFKHIQGCSVLYITFITCTCFSLQKATLTNDTKDKEYTPHDLPQRQSVQPQETCSIARRAKRMRSEVSLISPAVLWHCHVSFILCMICWCLFSKLGVWVNVHILMQPTHKEHRNDITEEQLILIYIVTMATFPPIVGVKVCSPYLIEGSVKCATVVLSVSLLWLSLWLRQRGCVKTQPGEICENRHNLRRRMGTYSAKPEPGKNKANKRGTWLKWMSILSFH